MTDLATAGSPKRPGLADGEGGEIIVKHERLFPLPFQRVDPLFVVGGSKGHHGQTLRLAAGEKRRPVCAGENSNLTSDRTDVGRPATVGPDPLAQNHLPDRFPFQLVEERFDLPGAIHLSGIERGDFLAKEVVESLLPFGLVWDQNRFLNRLHEEFSP